MSLPPLPSTLCAKLTRFQPSFAVGFGRHRCKLVAALSVVAAALGLVPANVPAAPINSDQVVGDRPAQTNNPELEQAVAKFNQQQYEDALALLNVAATKSPELPPGRAMLARLFVQANQIPTARAMLEQTALESPNDPEAYRMLGDLAFGERRLVESKLLFEKLAEVTSQFNGNARRKAGYESAAHAGLAAVAEARQQWDAAQVHLAAWIEKDPKNASAHHRLGQTLFGLDKPDEAFKELQLAASIAKEYPTPEVTMGRLYHQSGKEDQAATWMQKAIESAPDSLAARLGVAQWQWETGAFDDAQRNADAALKIKSDSLEALVIAGLVNRFRGDLPAAERHFQTAYLASPGNAMAANQLALVLADQSDEAKRRRAVELAESNAKQFSNNSEVASTLGWIYLQNNRLEDATKVFKAVAVSGRVSPDTAYFLAVLYDRMGNPQDALKALRPALEAKGPFAYRDDAKSLLARLQTTAGKPGATTATKASSSAGTPAPQAAKAAQPASRPATPKAGGGTKAPPRPTAPATKAPAKSTGEGSKAGAS